MTKTNEYTGIFTSRLLVLFLGLWTVTACNGLGGVSSHMKESENPKGNDGDVIGELTGQMAGLSVENPTSAPPPAAAVSAAPESDQKQNNVQNQQRTAEADVKSNASAADQGSALDIKNIPLKSKFQAFIDATFNRIGDGDPTGLLNSITEDNIEQTLTSVANQINPLPVYARTNLPEPSPQLTAIISALQETLQQEQCNVEDVKRQLTAWKNLLTSQETSIAHMLAQDRDTKRLLKSATLLLDRNEHSFLIETFGDSFELDLTACQDIDLIVLYAYIKNTVSMAHLSRGMSMTEDSKIQYQDLLKACQNSYKAYEAEQAAMGLNDIVLKRNLINGLIIFKIGSELIESNDSSYTLEGLKTTSVQKLKKNYQGYYDTKSYCFSGVERVTINCIKIAKEYLAAPDGDKNQAHKFLILAKANAQNIKSRLDGLRIQEVADSITYKAVVDWLKEINELLSAKP